MKTLQMNEEIKYCIYDKGMGMYYDSTLSYLRRNCIDEFLEYSTFTWDQYRKKGIECHKVTVRIKKVES